MTPTINPFNMNQTDIQQELRQLKRRRIEIRSAKAALDMEDFDLDDRQTSLEGLLRSRVETTPASSISHSEGNNQNSFQFTTLNKKQLEQSARRNAFVIANRHTQRVIKEEPKVTVQLYEIVDIEDDGGDGDENNDMVTSTGKDRPDHAQTLKISDKATTTRSLSRNAPSPESRRQSTLQSPQRPSKIVVLKVRFDPANSCRANSTTLQVKKPTPVKPRMKPVPARTQRTSNQHLTQAMLSSQASIKLHPPDSPPAHPPPPSTKKLRHTASQVILLDCPCEGRKRNCNTCYGTPAVIAEGQFHPVHPNTAALNVPLPRTVGQRPFSRPTSYRIPDYEEMSDSERNELELRFCLRIVLRLLTLQNTNPLNTTVAVMGSNWLWLETLQARPPLFTALLAEFQSLLKPKIVPRVTADGTWDGRILIMQCKDANEFKKHALECIAKLTGKHPIRCCVTENGVFDVSVTKSGGGGDGTESWAEGFTLWLTTRIRQCTECVNACDSALNLTERKKVVDEWDIR